MRNRIIPIVTMQAAGQPQPAHIARLATGIPTLDMALEDGLPLGNIVEISGKAHAGKTTLALQILAQAQRAGLRAVYICGVAPPPACYLAACGLDVEALSTPDAESTATLEGALDAAIEALNRGHTVVALDPLPAFPLFSEIEHFRDAVSDNRNGRRAQILDVAYAAMSSLLRRRSKTLAVLVNQERYNCGIMFGNPWEPTSHQVTDHFSVRLHLARVQSLKEEGEIIGSRIRVRVKKHAGGTPFTEAEFEILSHAGPDLWANILDLALVHGVITRENGCYQLNGEPLGRSRVEVKARLMTGYEGPYDLAHQLPDALLSLALPSTPTPTKLPSKQEERTDK